MASAVDAGQISDQNRSRDAVSGDLRPADRIASRILLAAQLSSQGF
jgi:hypothetical protein